MHHDTCTHPFCESKVSERLDAVHLCDRHAIAVYRAVASAMRDAGDTAAPVEGAGRARPLHSTQTRGVIYFIAFGDRIKIGFTTNLKQRLQVLAHDKVLATMPGTMTEEKRLHRQFAADRVNREWFRRSPDLLAFISGLAA